MAMPSFDPNIPNLLPGEQDEQEEDDEALEEETMEADIQTLPVAPRASPSTARRSKGQPERAPVAKRKKKAGRPSYKTQSAESISVQAASSLMLASPPRVSGAVQAALLGPAGRSPPISSEEDAVVEEDESTESGRPGSLPIPSEGDAGIERGESGETKSGDSESEKTAAEKLAAVREKQNEASPQTSWFWRVFPALVYFSAISAVVGGPVAGYLLAGVARDFLL